MKIESYSISLDFRSSSDYVNGYERIVATHNGETFELDASDISIKSVKVNDEERTFTLDQKNSKVVIDGGFNGPCDIDIVFVSKVSKALRGLYRVKVGDDEFFTTDFEPTGARRMIPCVDNPSYKAAFLVSVTVDNEIDAISNMPVKGTAIVTGRKKIEFESTPPMSTYLLYIGVGKFSSITDKLNGKEITLIAPSGSLYSTDFPVKSAIRSIKFYEDYFGIPYQLPKLHLVSVPDFAAGAMENWGAITFRERYLQAEKNSSQVVLERIEEVVAHELAHQWFGDLVTMKWWNDLWLNESFATFMAFKAVDANQPHYEIMKEFVNSEKNGALLADSLSTTHPVDVEVKKPEEISQIFDEISYGKGGNVLRMLESYLGHDGFRDGIRSYLKKYSFSNASGSDLWEELSSVTGQPVSSIVRAWITKSGYPYIEAHLDHDSIKLKQGRFTLLPSDKKDVWPVPLIIKRKGGDERLLLDSETATIPAKDFVKIDSGSMGFYRVFYDSRLLKNLLGIYSTLPALDRWSIINDLNAAFLSGKVRMVDYSRTLQTFCDDDDPFIMDTLMGDMFYLLLIDPGNQNLRQIFLDSLLKFKKKLGEPASGEKHFATVARSSVYSYLPLLDKKWAADFSANFPKYHDFNPDLRRGLAVAEAIAKNDASVLLEAIRKSRTDESRQHLIYALGVLNGEKNYAQVKKAIEDNVVPKQDCITAFISQAMNPDNREVVFKDFTWILDFTTSVFGGSGYVARVVERIAPLVGLGRKEEMKKFLFGIQNPEASTGVKKGLEYLEIFSSVRERMRE